MTARTGVIIFTAVWVFTSIASGEGFEAGASAREDSAVTPDAPNQNRRSLYAPTSIELRPVALLGSEIQDGRASLRHDSEIIPAGFADPASDASEAVVAGADAADDKAAATEPFLDLRSESTAQLDLPPEEATNSQLFIQLAVWTVIILCGCVLVVLGIRYVQRRQGLIPESDQQSRVLRTLSLGAHRTISLVQLGEVQAVVGCDSTGVSNIVLVPNSFEMELLNTNPEVGPDFQDQLFEGSKLAS